MLPHQCSRARLLRDGAITSQKRGNLDHPVFRVLQLVPPHLGVSCSQGFAERHSLTGQLDNSLARLHLPLGIKVRLDL